MKIVTLGEIMLRLSTNENARFRQVDEFAVCYGGGEANVAVSLANYGHDAYFMSKVPSHEIGQCAVDALNKYGDIVLTKNSKNDVIIMSISEYKRKLKDNELSKKLEKAEQQIKDGKTVKATTVFRELEEKYGF